MESLKIVCPKCMHVNRVENAVKRSKETCEKCGAEISDPTPLESSEEMFKTMINDNDIPVIVDFFSPDCAPCMQMAPDFETAANSYSLEVRYIKINCLNEPDLARQYGINDLPTVIAFKNGMELNRFNSSLSLDQLKMWSDSLIQMQI